MTNVEGEFITHPFGRCTVKNFAMDSSRWGEFSFREGDIVIASWARSGTTWLQQIIGQLLLGPDPALRLDRLSPWVEHRATPLALVLRHLRAQSDRRFLKTHLPANALPLSRKARYLFIGRDGRDIALSLYNFHRRHTPLAYSMLRAVANQSDSGLPPAAEDFETYFDEWLEGDGYPWWPFWSHIRSWWVIRNFERVCLVHYSNLISNYDAEVKRISDFLEIHVPEDRWASILELCTFESMKSNSDAVFGPLANRFLEGGMREFFRAGKANAWRNLVSSDRAARYDQRANRELPPACAKWLDSGEVA